MLPNIILLLHKKYKDAEAESRAGYEILNKQSSAPQRWIQNARTDLLHEYEALTQPEMAARFRSDPVEATSVRSVR